jgi:predicted O-methyltransferase YrrM
MYLDTIAPLTAQVGYGALGAGGSLGYEGKRVLVQGRAFEHALSTHPPARLRFDLGGRYRDFRCQVALNDDVAGRASEAEFMVSADGRPVAQARVGAGLPPQLLRADLRGVRRLELAVVARQWEYCHAVWLDPELDGPAGAPERGATNGAGERAVYLDTLPARQVEVGHGALGLHGDLGYEEKRVIVRGQHDDHALSAHAPARLVYDLDGRFTHFAAQVALNDDVAVGAAHADFRVLADGRLVAQVAYVVAGEPPRDIAADLAGARTLELVVETTRWPYCHAVWLAPRLAAHDTSAHVAPARTLVDCLGRAEITPPAQPPRAARCIATTVSPGFVHLLDDLLGSVYANSGCQDALVAVFAVDLDDECRRVAAKYGATLIPCAHRAKVNATVKSVLYSAAHAIDADQFLCLDADMLVLGDLRPVFAALDACPPGSILACREANGSTFRNLDHALTTVYGGRSGDIARISGQSGEVGAYPLVVNDGAFAASRAALLALDGLLRGWPAAPAWVDERRDIWWRNQFVFNLALAQLGGVELDPCYNVQLNSQDADFRWAAGRVDARWQGRPARVLHFNGLGRHKYPAWRGLFARVPDPLAGAGDGDGYAAFVAALRAWAGRHGLRALAWSFYGLADATTARVRDPGALPLLACLHYLVRANGCGRVLETGAARGVSAACLASAVAHRAGGRVVTFDLEDYPERADLWDALPAAQAACIEPRRGDALAGLAAALDAGERYDAALLDSRHTEEHVWAEFALAARLVCPGGLILIHDACLPSGTVGRALARIAAAGYGVTRLWTAECGVPEDDRLGLAVIENRRRAAVEG